MGKLIQDFETPSIGLTGGIASGKTLVAALFEMCGAAVCFADQMAKDLMTSSNEVRNKLVDMFGEEVYFEDGSLNRSFLGSKIFNDDKLLKQVNSIIHPTVRKATRSWHARMIGKVPYTVYESALLFESGAWEDFDLVVHVYAPRAMRLERAMERDRATKEQIEARMEAQWTDQQRLDQKAYVIVNDGSKPLIPQVYELHQAIINFSKNKAIS